MIKPLWALAGVALLGTATAAGVYAVASSGGEEEVVQQVGTAAASPVGPKDPRTTPTATPACDPNPIPATGSSLWRWGDVTVQIPQDSEILAVGDFVGQDPRPALVISVGGWGRTEIDAATGAVISEDPKGDRAAEIDAVLGTVAVCPFDPRTAPWPYSGEPPAGPRMTIFSVSYLEPDPASGIQVQVLKSCGDSTTGDSGCRDFLVLVSARSSVYLSAEDGRMVEPAKIAAEEQEAFNRFLSSLQATNA